MQYALMIYAEPGYGEALPEEERDAVYAEFWRWPRTPGPSRLRGCSPPRRRPPCGWSAVGR